MELLALRAVRHGRSFTHFCYGDGSGFGPIFVDLDFSHLLHHRHIYIIYIIVLLLYHVGKLSSILTESPWHAHRREYLLKMCLVFGGETGQQDIDFGRPHLMQLLLQVLCREVLDDVANSLTLVGKHHNHAIASIAIRQTQQFAQVVLAVGRPCLEVHHRKIDGCAVQLREVSVAGLIGVKFLGPGSLEINGIQQVHHAIGVEFTVLQDLRYHTVGVFLAPVVDFVHDAAFIVANHIG